MKSLLKTCVLLAVSVFFSTINAFSQSIVNGGSGQGLISLVPDRFIEPEYKNIKPESSMGFWRLMVTPERISTGLQELQVSFEFEVDKPTNVRGYNINGGDMFYNPEDFQVNITGSIEYILKGKYTLPDTKEEITFEKRIITSKFGKTVIKGGLFGWGPATIDAIAKSKIKNEANPLESFLSKFNVRILSIEAVEKTYSGFELLDSKIGKRLEEGRKELKLNNLLADAENAETFGDLGRAIEKYEEAYALKKDPAIKAKLDKLRAKQKENDNKLEADKVTEQARNAEANGNYEEAKKLYKKANTLSPNPDTEKAITRVEQKLRENPENKQQAGKPSGEDASSANTSQDKNATPATKKGLPPQNSKKSPDKSDEQQNRQRVDDNNNALLDEGNRIYESSFRVQQNIEQALEPLKNTIINDIQQKEFERDLNRVLGQSFPPDPVNLIRNQEMREIEAIRLLQQKQEAVRDANNEQELRAIKSAQNPMELQMISGAVSLAKVINEISFRQEKKKLLQELKEKNKREIDNLYTKITTPLIKSRDAYRVNAAGAWKKEEEKLAADWVVYYEEILRIVNRDFSLNHTDWAKIDVIAGTLQKPSGNLNITQTTPKTADALAAAKRKIQAWDSGDPSVTLTTLSGESFNLSDYRKIIETSIVYHSGNPEKKQEKETLLPKWPHTLKQAAVLFLTGVIEKENNAEAYHLLGLLNTNLEQREQLLSTAYSLAPKNNIYKEDAHWAWVLKQDQPHWFEEYLQTYPDGIYRQEAQDYLTYRAELDKLEKLPNDAERKQRLEDYKTIKKNLWYKKAHWTAHIYFDEIEAEIIFSTLKKGFYDPMYHQTDGLKRINDFISAYDHTSFGKPARDLIPEAEARQKFNYIEVDFQFMPIGVINYEETSYSIGSSGTSVTQFERKETGKTTMLTALISVPIRYYSVITPVKKMQKYAWGFFVGMQMRSYRYSKFDLTSKSSSSTSTSKQTIKFDGGLSYSIEGGAGIAKYLYFTLGYQRFAFGDVSKYDKKTKIQTVYHPLATSNALMMGLQSEFSLAPATTVSLNYRNLRYSNGGMSDKLRENNFQFRIFFYDKAKPLAFFLSFERSSILDDNIGVYPGYKRGYVVKVKQSFFGFGIRMGGSYKDY